MAEFLNNPVLTVSRAGNWILVEDLKYQSDLLPYLIIAPAGFETDLASIPFIVPRTLFDVNGKSRRAAIIHDLLVRHKVVPRRKADAIFREALKLDGEAAWRRWVMWAAVRLNTERLILLGRAK